MEEINKNYELENETEGKTLSIFCFDSVIISEFETVIISLIVEQIVRIGSMISFDDFKKALGPAASNYTDTQIDRIRLIFDSFADVTFDLWLSKRNNI